MFKRIRAGLGQTVSIVLPVFNGAAYLREAVDSILRQTHGDFELIVVDDGSTDGTASILGAMADPRLRVLRNDQRLRLAGALNRGLDAAAGDFVARMDADDVAHPERLATQVRFLRQHAGIDLCGTWTRHFGPGMAREVMRYPVAPGCVSAFTLFLSPFAHPTVMFRRDAWEMHRLRYDGGYYPTEDFELWFRALQHLRGANVPRPLLDYRVHGQSMTGADWTCMDEQAGRVCLLALAKLGLEPEVRDIRFHRAVAMRRVGPDAAGLQRAAVWLQRIREANAQRCVHDPAALATVTADLWFQNCMGATALGMAAWRLYRATPLRARGARRLRDELLLLLSALRRGGVAGRKTDSPGAKNESSAG